MPFRERPYRRRRVRGSFRVSSIMMSWSAVMRLRFEQRFRGDYFLRCSTFDLAISREVLLRVRRWGALSAASRDGGV